MLLTSWATPPASRPSASEALRAAQRLLQPGALGHVLHHDHGRCQPPVVARHRIARDPQAQRGPVGVDPPDGVAEERLPARDALPERADDIAVRSGLEHRARPAEDLAAVQPEHAQRRRVALGDPVGRRVDHDRGARAVLDRRREADQALLRAALGRDVARGRGDAGQLAAVVAHR